MPGVMQWEVGRSSPCRSMVHPLVSRRQQTRGADLKLCRSTQHAVGYPYLSRAYPQASVRSRGFPTLHDRKRIICRLSCSGLSIDIIQAPRGRMTADVSATRFPKVLMQKSRGKRTPIIDEALELGGQSLGDICRPSSPFAYLHASISRII